MKKTLATLLVVALVASLCGVMFVSAESVNLAAGKSYTTTAIFTTDGVQNWPDEGGVTLTDGVKAAADAGYGDPCWTGFNKQSSDYDASEGGYGAITIIDLGAVCELDKIAYQACKDTGVGITVPYWANLYVSEDGENYTQAGYIEANPDEAPAGVNQFECAVDVSARYVKICLYMYGWGFIDEFEVFGTAPATEGGDDPAPEAPAETTLSVTHVNLYSWNAYRCQIITGEGNSCASYAHTAFDATEYVVLKVENVDGAYTVTAIEGAGVAKTLTAPADGFLLYCGNKDPDNFAIVGNVKVGDVVLANTVDLATDAASETVIGTITFGSAAEEDGPGDAGVLVFAVLAVVAIAGCAVATKIKSSAL